MVHIYDTNQFGKSTGIPSLEYFDREMKGENLPNFINACKDSPDIITGMPKPQQTMGSESFDLPFAELPEFTKHALNAHAALVYFRRICGYVPDKKEPKVNKIMTMDSLSEVQTPKAKRESNS